MPSFETPQPISITVEVVLGDVRVTASDRTDTVAVVQPTNAANVADVAAAADTQVEFGDGRLLISTPKRWRRYSPFDNGGSVQVAVEVPTGSSLEASSSLGDIRVDGEVDRCRVRTSMGDIRLDRSGRLTAKTGFGNVDVDRVEGDADVTTGSGDLRIGTVHGAAVVKNSNGATSIDDVSGDVRVRSSNGSITVSSAGRSIVAKTAAGSIEVGEIRRGVAVLVSAAGDLSCGIAGGTAVNLDVRSKHGRIQSGLEASEGPAPTDEVAQLHAHTTVGDITLFRTDGLAQPAT